MKIGLLSDTHSKINKAKKALDFLVENGAEFIIHAGDIVEHEILELLANCGKRYIAVYGNNDAHLVHHHNNYHLVQEPYYFKLAETTFKLMHLPFYMTPDAEVIIFGHTHQFEVEFKGGSLYLNPGEVCARKKALSECAILEVKSNKFIVNYYTQKKKDEFSLKKSYEFKR
ncbi:MULTISPECIES: YfcE family phosphodiesterase [Sulfurimonas]|uniref:YfcE family phosphodiesterase n=1 Tax=Sulfurimonas TaxID=202746 RepID=UPI001264BC15|nr:YfcE family phosphodiesterase [Sulfurimonas indica]